MIFQGARGVSDKEVTYLHLKVTYRRHRICRVVANKKLLESFPCDRSQVSASRIVGMAHLSLAFVGLVAGS
jgi:hypothetical protein